MANRLFRQTAFARVLTSPTTTPRQRRALIQTSSPDQIKLILELIGNTLQGNLALTEAEKAKLRPKRKTLKRLWGERATVAIKRRELLRNTRSVATLLKSVHVGVLEKVDGRRDESDTGGESPQGEYPETGRSDTSGGRQISEDGLDDGLEEDEKADEEERRPDEDRSPGQDRPSEEEEERAKNEAENKPKEA